MIQSATGPVIEVSSAPRRDPRQFPTDGGPPLGENEHLPMPATYSFDDLVRGLNPLHHVPVVGTIYRAVTGETIPAAERIAVSVVTSALMGGPLGILATIVSTLVEELWRMGPDPSTPRWGEHPPPKLTGYDTPSGSG